jgi:hypothetical protein
MKIDNMISKKYIVLALCIFSFIYINAQPVLLPVKEKGLWGYADSKEKIVIPHQYHDAQFFVENMGRVRKDGLYGFIDEKGHWKINNIYINAYDFSNGLALVTDTLNHQFFINHEGEKEVDLPEEIIQAEPFVNGYAKISQQYQKKRNFVDETNYYMGFIDTLGRVSIKPQYDDVSNFEDGIAHVLVNKKMGLINTEGKYILKPSYDFIGTFKEGLAVCADGEKYGFINESGKLVIAAKYDNAGDFGDGLAPVKNGQFWGYIDNTGKQVIEPKYIWAESFSQGLAGVVVDKKWGMVTPTGELKIRAIFDDYAPFSEGLAAVKYKGLWGFLNTNGELSILPQFEMVGSFVNGITIVETTDKAVYLDKRGIKLAEYNIEKDKLVEKRREIFWNQAEEKLEKEMQEYIEWKKKQKNKK